MEKKNEPRVEFGRGHALAIAALFAGAAIAIGVPAVVLGLGHSLTAQMQLWLIVLAVIVGGATSLVAAFFGTVMPSSVGGTGDSPCATDAVGQQKAEAAK